MKYFIALLLCAGVAQADTRIYETNRFGQTQYHKPSLVVKGDKVYEVNKYGQTQYHKPRAVVKPARPSVKTGTKSK